MSTHGDNVKLTCQTEVNACAEKGAFHNNTTEDWRSGRLHNKNGNEQWLNGTSSEDIQISKNLCIEQTVHLKSRQDWDIVLQDHRNSPDQRRFTSCFSLKFPSKKSDRNSTDKHKAAQKRDVVKKTANGHQPELFEKTLPSNSFKQLATTAHEVQDAAESSLENSSSQNHLTHDISSHILTAETQHSLELCQKTTGNCSQRQSTGSCHGTNLTLSATVGRGSGFNDPHRGNAEGVLSYSNPIHLQEDISSAADTDCQAHGHSPKVLKRALSLPSFTPTHHRRTLETKSNCDIHADVMFTSTLVSVLAPHWSGRLRRNKRGVTEAEQDVQMTEQNISRSVSGQDVSEQQFPKTSMQQGGEKLDKINSMLKRPLEPSRNSAEWQNESSSPNLTGPIQSKIPLEDSNKDISDSGSLPLDPGHMSRSSLSSQLSGYTPASQAEDKGKSFSHSRPITSSLLLSLRRINARKVSVDSSDLEKQHSTSVNDQTSSSKSIFRVSQPCSHLVSSNDPYQVAFARDTFPTTSEKPSFSPKIRETEECRKPLLLSKREFDINKRMVRLDVTTDGQFPSSSSNFSQAETTEDPEHCSREILERNYSNVERRMLAGQRNTDSTNLQKSNVNSRDRTFVSPRTCISPRDNTNSNFVFPHTEFNTGDLNLHNFHISDRGCKRQVSQTPAISPNHISSTSAQIISTNNSTHLDKASTVYNPGISMSTTTQISHVTPNPTNSPVINLYSALKSRHMSQSGQNSTQNSTSGSLSPEEHSSSSRTFTNSLMFSPRKTPSAVEETTSSPVRQDYLSTHSNCSSLSSTSPLSPSRPFRRVRAPSIYSYLRETSPTLAPQTSPSLTSPSLQTTPLKQNNDQNKATLMFTFDLSPTQDSCASNAPQSLPPNLGHRSRLSKSPYSTLISSRPALNNSSYSLSFSPPPCQHSRSASYDGSTINANTPIHEKSSYSSMPKDNLLQRSPKVVDSDDEILKSKTGQTSAASLDTNNIVRMSPDPNLIGCQATSITQNAAKPKQCDIVIKNVSKEGHDDMFLCQRDNSSIYAAQSLSGDTVSKTIQEGRETEQAHEKLEGVQNPYLKKTLFLIRRKKDNIPSSRPGDKERLANENSKKTEMTALKSSHRMDLVLNRLKQKFGVKCSEDDEVAVSRKLKNSQPLDVKSNENTRKQEETCLRSQTLTLPNPANSQITMLRGSCSSSGTMSGFTSNNERNENSLHVVEPKRHWDENRNHSLYRPPSPNRLKSHYHHRYATMPQDRKSTSVHSPFVYSFDLDSADAQNDNVFHNFPMRRKTTSLCETDDVPDSVNVGSQSLNRQMSTSCVSLKYGLDRGRSVSVSSVVSGRPSGPGRISTGSRTNSISDLTSLEEFGTRSSISSTCSPDDSASFALKVLSSHPFQNTSPRLWSPASHETSACSWDPTPPPTPPPSPPFSPTNRRMAQIPSTSSTGSRTSQDSLSPRGFLPSRNYTSTLSTFDETSSETTTDDEYYLNSDDDDDEKETEL